MLRAVCPHCLHTLLLTVTGIGVAGEVAPTLQRVSDLLDQGRLSGRVRNRLWGVGLELVRDVEVIPDGELLKIKHFGRGALAELRAVVPYRKDPQAWLDLRAWLAIFRVLPFEEQLAAINARVGRRIYDTDRQLPTERTASHG